MPFHLNKINRNTLIKALNQKPPGIKAHQTMMPEGRSLTIPEDEYEVKSSAVLLLFYPEGDELHFCLTKRNRKLKHHPGQISFPGGKCEPHETNPLTTALRETEEEIGVNAHEIEILGQLTELYVSVSNFIIYPFVGWIHRKPTFTINTFEVEELITLPLQTILNTVNKTVKTVETSYGTFKVPCYFIDEYLIWGATSMMIAELEEILKLYYSHRATHSGNDDNDRSH